MSFLDTFLAKRKPVADEFPFPEYAESPVEIYRRPDDVIQRLEAEPNESYSIYWNSTDENLDRMAMLFFTRDGAMIAGLARDNDPRTMLSKIAGVVGGRFGFVTAESPPPDSVREFLVVCRESALPALNDGVVE